MSGKVGNLTYAQTKHGTVVYPSRRKAKIPRRSEKQMLVRLQWANLGAVYKQYNKTLKKAYEDVVGSNLSVFNAFIQANMSITQVYVPKQVRLNGGSVLAPYQISRGSLESIYYAKNAGNVLVTDLMLGNLAIDAQTSVAQFSAALLNYNAGWEKDDQLTFFYGRQIIDAVSGVPRAKINGAKIRLDLSDQTPLWDLVGDMGFSSVDGTSTGSAQASYHLGMAVAITDGAAAWIHSREDDEAGTLAISTQFMFVDSTVLARYQGTEAFETSAESYGGINTKAVYLQPDEKTNQSGTAIYSDAEMAYGHTDPSTSSGQGTETPGGGGGNTNGTNSTNQGSATGSGANGGSSTGSDTQTVNAPSFAGETQCAESTEVTITGPDGATIHYTTDGSTPTAESAVYSEPLTFTETTTLKAIAIKDGVSSAVTTRTYTKGTNGSGVGGED